MNIARLSVNRPVTTIMVFTAIILLGIISWGRLPQELFPSITYPQITVVSTYQNAAPEEIENLLTKVIEETVGTVNNVKRISSISKEGLSLVMVEFNWGTNMDFAALNVREKIDLIKERIPREAGEPVVMKYNPFDLPVMNLAVTGPMGSLELRELCRKYIKDAIEKVEGVASATITGGDEREIVVEIDQPRLRASQLSIVSVIDSIRTANINYPAGTIKESFYEYLIRTMGEYQKLEEIQETPAALDSPEEQAKTRREKELKEKSGRRLVYLKDIAKVKDSVKEKTSISRYNGKDSISLVVRKQSGTNTLNVVKGVKREIEKVLAEKLPKGIKIQLTYDQSQFIQEALNNVRDAAVQGAFLAFLVLFFFLREFKSSFVITLSIPISIMATFCLMYFSKINLNMMSLGGLALGVGMLVDNSIVVIENIFRMRQMKKSLKEACIEGTGEMTGPIFGSTLTTVAVFLPFAFVVGIIGQIFKQLSLTITFALLVSIIVALSLVPVLISLGRKRSAPGARLFQRIKDALEERTNAINYYVRQRYFSYSDFVDNMLKKKEKVIYAVLVLFALSVIIMVSVEKQFLPKVDQRQFIVKVDLPPGTRIELTDNVVKKIEKLLLKLKETKDVTINIGSSEEKTSAQETNLQTLGSHQAQIMVNLKKKSQGLGIKRSTEDVIQYLKSNLEKEDLENAKIDYIAQETSFGTALEQGAPIAVEIKGPDLNKLLEISSLVQSRMKKLKGVYGIKIDMPAPSPETKLNILKDKASLYGLSVRDIAVTAQVSLKGFVATKFKGKIDQEDVDIRVRLRPEDRSSFGNLRRLLIHSPAGMNVPLSEVAYLTKGRGPTEIRRIDQQRSVLLTANVYKQNIRNIAKAVDNIILSLRPNIPKDYSLQITGEQQKMQESFKSLAFALILAFILVYMIMAGEFESLWQPLLIIFTIPLSLIGVAFALFISRTPLSSVAYLGIIMLGGIAVNNGIVLIDFVNVLRKEGHSPYDAVLEASKARLRPILMTSLTTILGLLPLALGIGEGAELQAPLAITVMGGLTSATFLTLIFIPALYLVAVRYIEKKGLYSPRETEEEIEVKKPVFTPSVKTKPPITIMPKIIPTKEPIRDKEVPPTKPKEAGKDIKETSGDKDVKETVKDKGAGDKKQQIQTIKPAEAEKTEPIEKNGKIKEESPVDKPKPTEEIKTPPLPLPSPLPVKELPKEDKGKEVKEPPGGKRVSADLNPRQKELLEKLKELKKITRKDYAKMFNVSVPTASRDLKELVDKKLLEGKGPLGPGRWYELLAN